MFLKITSFQYWKSFSTGTSFSAGKTPIVVHLLCRKFNQGAHFVTRRDLNYSLVHLTAKRFVRFLLVSKNRLC